MNNVIGTAPSAGGPGAEFFTSAYEESTTPRLACVHRRQAYDAMAVEILAATAAGENNGEAIRDRVGPSRTPAARSSVGKPPRSGRDCRRRRPRPLRRSVVERQLRRQRRHRHPRYDVQDFQDGEIVTLDTLEFGNELSEEDLNATAADPVGSTASSRRRSAC